MFEILGAVAGPAAGGAGALALLWQRRKSAKPTAEPPSATFQEWIAAIVAEDEEQREDPGVSTVRGSEWVSAKPLRKPKHPLPTGSGTEL
jgi:hypothetical protein